MTRINWNLSLHGIGHALHALLIFFDGFSQIRYPCASASSAQSVFYRLSYVWMHMLSKCWDFLIYSGKMVHRKENQPQSPQSIDAFLCVLCGCPASAKRRHKNNYCVILMLFRPFPSCAYLSPSLRQNPPSPCIKTRAVLNRTQEWSLQ